MEQKYAPIETLIERFFEGTTSHEEERELYDFFLDAGDELPEHLQEYRGVFGWFDTGMAGEVAEKEPVYELPGVESKGVEGYKGLKDAWNQADERKLGKEGAERRSRKVWMRWASVAASLVLAITVYSLYTMEKRRFDPLAGSYIIRNGVKITDMDEIRPELESTIQIALQQEARAQRLFDQLRDPATDEFLSAQEQMQQQYCQIISQFTDPLVREEVEKMLDIRCND